MSRAISRAPSWMERRILRAGALGQHCGFSKQASQSSLLAAIAHHAVLIDQRARHSIDFLALSEFLPGWADVAVAFVVIGKVVAREGAVGALGFVEHRNVRLDITLMHQPGKVLSRTVGGVSRQPLRAQAEALLRPVDHPLLRPHLGLADRGRRFHIDDDGVLQVDQVVRAVGEEGEPAFRTRPARGRVGRRDELRHDRRCRAERRIIEHGKIFPHGMARCLGGLPLGFCERQRQLVRLADCGSRRTSPRRNWRGCRQRRRTITRPRRWT
jgi:hypothetical protein